MALIFANRGSTFAFNQNGSKMVHVEGFDALGGGNPMFATSIQASDEDVVGRVVCLNDKRILFDFGKGFGDFALQGEVLMGNTMEARGSITGNVGDVASFWNSKRVSVTKKALTVSISGEQSATNVNFLFFLHKVQIGPINAEIMVCSFTLIGTLVKMW